MFRDRLVEQHIRRRRRRHYNYWAFLWVAPVVVLISIFSAYPLINSFILSLTNSSGSGYGDFVGLDNFVELFQDEVFWICMKNVVIFTVVGIVCGNFMTILLAELLFNLKFKKTSAILRVLFILPVLVPSVVVLLVWENLIFSSSGLVNQMFLAMGKEPIAWYFENPYNFIAIIATNFPWVGGTSFLIYLAGLQNINKSVFEASRLDGISGFRRVFRIDLPLIKGQLKYFLIMGVIGGLQNFDLQLIITGSGPGTTNGVNVPGYYIFQLAWSGEYDVRYGYASAIGVVIFIITIGFSIANFRKNKREVMQ